MPSSTRSIHNRLPPSLTKDRTASPILGSPEKLLEEVQRLNQFLLQSKELTEMAEPKDESRLANINLSLEQLQDFEHNVKAEKPAKTLSEFQAYFSDHLEKSILESVGVHIEAPVSHKSYRR